MKSIRDTYEEHYLPKLAGFVSEVGAVNFDGIPEVHLPLWGEGYATALPRVAFIGRDTRYWGAMKVFIEEAKRDPKAAIFRSEEEFHDLRFTEWTNNFGTSFWDTVMQLLAAIHRIDDWKELKNRQRDELLQSFVWAQTNAVERWDATPSIEGADFQSWAKVKTASERSFDSFQSILNIFAPDVAIVMNWGVSAEYWGLPLSWETLGDHARYAFAEQAGTHVFHTAHPTWMRGERRDEIFRTIFEKWESCGRCVEKEAQHRIH